MYFGHLRVLYGSYDILWYYVSCWVSRIVEAQLIDSLESLDMKSVKVEADLSGQLGQLLQFQSTFREGNSRFPAS